MFFFSLYAYGLIYYLVDGQVIDTCMTPLGDRSVCKSIYECDNLLALVKKKDRTPQDLELLKESQCKFSENITVCCPETCYTPDAQPGICRSLKKCEHVANMLKQTPLSQENMIYVQNSKCFSAHENSVCCGPPITSPPPIKSGSCQDTVTAFPPDPRSGCCGVETMDSRSSSSTSVIYKNPWLVTIEYEYINQDEPNTLICGGVLISRRYALTNGQCISESDTIVRPVNVHLGKYTISNDDPDCIPLDTVAIVRNCTKGSMAIPIERIILYPYYMHYSEIGLRIYDIALLRLRQLAPYTDFIRPICLPNTDITLAPSDELILFNAQRAAPNSSETHQIGLPYHSPESCKKVYEDIPAVHIWDKQVCAGGEETRNTCAGIPGGPLMYNNQRQYEIIGLFSFEVGNCKDYPSVFTKVYEYATWIRSNIKP